MGEPRGCAVPASERGSNPGRGRRRIARSLGVAIGATAAAIAVAAAGVAADAGPGPRTVLVRPLAGTGADFAVAILALGEDSLISGFTEAADGADAGFLLRVGPAGEVVWRRDLPSGGDGALWSLRALADGTFAAAGWTKGPGGDLDARLVRFDAAGSILWQRDYPGPGAERLWSLDVSREGLVAGGESVASDGGARGLVLRAALDGAERSRRLVGEAPVERDFSIAATDDGGFVLAGMAGSGPRESSGYDARIARYAADGALVWSRLWGGPGYDVAHGVVRRADGGFAAVGYTTAGAGRGTDVFLLRLDAAGAVEGATTLGGPEDDRAVEVAALAGGGYAIVGASQTPAQDWDLVVRAVGERGELRWERRFGGARPELGRALAIAGDELRVAGHSGSYGALERILYLRLGGLSAS